MEREKLPLLIIGYKEWFLRIGRYVIALKSPRHEPLFSERNRRGVRVIPLGFGWRITIRRDSKRNFR